MSNPAVDFSAAATFIQIHARLIDRHRFTYHFAGGNPEAVLSALRPYQNPDGGFGHALEADHRGPSSQPGTTATALTILSEIDRFTDPMVTQALDFLQTATQPDGGVPVALPSIAGEPRAPWWEIDVDNLQGMILPTALITGLLHKHQVDHPWRETATDFCWRAIEAIETTHPYEVRFSLAFLDHVPDRERAQRQAERLISLLREQRLVLVNPTKPEDVIIAPGYAEGEFHTPLDYAPRPESVARPYFSDQEITTALDTLISKQRPDGGWMFNWREWNPVVTWEWRGAITTNHLLTLRAYNRL